MKAVKTRKRKMELAAEAAAFDGAAAAAAAAATAAPAEPDAADATDAADAAVADGASDTDTANDQPGLPLALPAPSDALAE